MFIQIREIQKLFPDIPCRHNKAQKRQLPFCLDRFLIITSVPDNISQHILYVTKDPAAARQICSFPNTSILFLTEKLNDPDSFTGIDTVHQAVLILQTLDMDMVCQRLESFYSEKYATSFLAESLLEILFYEGGIQAMVEKVYPAFWNPIYVFDNNFHLIASTWDAAADANQGQSIIDTGGFTEKEYEVLNLSKTHQKMMNSDFPIRTRHPIYGYEQLLCAIDTQKDMGHIVINGLNHDLSKQDEQMLYLLKKAIDQQMKKDEFIRNNRGFHYEYFLRDLLDGKMAVGKPLSGRMDYVNTEFSGNLYCMVIETARSSHTLNTMHIRSLFETRFPDTMTLMYNGGILILFRLSGQHFFTQQDYDGIMEICRDYGLYAGMGNSFHDIFDISEYYLQGLRSIELGICSQNEPGLFLYKDYYLSHMASVFSQKESVATFCHPQLQILLDYDSKNGTDLAHILYVYLICERNMQAASQMMYMHRNTLIYRLKKINTLISVDYENYLERQHIILSYELQKMNQK